MFTEDLSVFFNTDEFAIAATYDAAGVNTTIAVIFDNSYLQQVGLVASSEPVALAKASAVAVDPVGKTLTVSGVGYVIRNIEPVDDGAVVLLRLEKAA